MKLEEMSRDERSLLLYFETRAVDYGGRVDVRMMNDGDMQIAKMWHENGFIRFGRIVIRDHNGDGTHWCKLSEEAWKLAHEERRAREKRLWLKKDWMTTEDSRDTHGDPHFSNMNKGNKSNLNEYKQEDELGKKVTRK